MIGIVELARCKCDGGVGGVGGLGVDAWVADAVGGGRWFNLAGGWVGHGDLTDVNAEYQKVGFLHHCALNGSWPFNTATVNYEDSVDQNIWIPEARTYHYCCQVLSLSWGFSAILILDVQELH